MKIVTSFLAMSGVVLWYAVAHYAFLSYLGQARVCQ